MRTVLTTDVTITAIKSAKKSSFSPVLESSSGSKKNADVRKVASTAAYALVALSA